MGEPVSTLADYIAVIITLVNYLMLRRGIRLGTEIRDHQRGLLLANKPPPPRDDDGRPNLRLVSGGASSVLLAGLLGGAVGLLKTVRDKPMALAATGTAATLAVGTATLITIAPWTGPAGTPELAPPAVTRTVPTVEATGASPSPSPTPPPSSTPRATPTPTGSPPVTATPSPSPSPEPTLPPPQESTPPPDGGGGLGVGICVELPMLEEKLCL